MFEINDTLKYYVLNKKKDNLTIEPAIVDHCNLNCAYCDHMSPIADVGFYDVNQFDKDFKALSTLLLSDYIRQRYNIIIQLVGGEPFLHPQLLDFVDIIYKYIPVDILKSFIIITNGTLFHKRMDLSKRYRELLKKYDKPGISITKYPGIDEDFIKKSYYEFIGNDHAFISLDKRYTFNKVNLDFSVRDLSGYCSNNCMCLRDSKLFKCPISGNIHFLMKKLNSNLQVLKEEDYLDLTRPITTQEFEDFRTKPRNFCFYCKERSWNIPWKKSTGDVKEWLK